MPKFCGGQLKGTPHTQGPWRFRSQQDRFFLKVTEKRTKPPPPGEHAPPRVSLRQPHAPRSRKPGQGCTVTAPSPSQQPASSHDSHPSAASRAQRPGHPAPPPWGGCEAAPVLKMAARLQCLRRALKPQCCWLRWRLLTCGLRGACPWPTWLPLPYYFRR